jgi:hypothetical protein
MNVLKETLKGIVNFRDIGMGCWEFVSNNGDKYEIIGGDDSLYKDGQKAAIKGRIRKDLMSSGNIGPIFEVDSSELEAS